MTKAIYDKPPLTLEQQAALLLSRGLNGITKPELIERLAQVNYYRLRGYTYPYQDNSCPNTPFLPNTTWQQIWNDYTLDTALRSLLFESISHIEVSVRTQLILQFSLAHGSRWYQNANLFANHECLINDTKELYSNWHRAREVFKKHYEAEYDNAASPPAWMIFETTTFGNVSKFLSNLKNNLAAKEAVARHFGFTKSSAKVLESWLQHLNLVRNICAHHSRLFFRSLIVKPIQPTTKPAKWVSAWSAGDKVFVSVCIVTHLLGICAPDYDFCGKLKAVLQNVSEKQLAMMGFPAGWETEDLFKR